MWFVGRQLTLYSSLGFCPLLQGSLSICALYYCNYNNGHRHAILIIILVQKCFCFVQNIMRCITSRVQELCMIIIIDTHKYIILCYHYISLYYIILYYIILYYIICISCLVLHKRGGRRTIARGIPSEQQQQQQEQQHYYYYQKLYFIILNN